MSENLIKQRKHGELQLALVSLLGTENLRDKWWLSPNKNWNGKCPQDIWDSEDWESVWKYVMVFCYGR